jgi:hypothetical protein
MPIYIYRTEVPPRHQVATSADIAVCSICFTGITIRFLLSATWVSENDQMTLVQALQIPHDHQSQLQVRQTGHAVGLPRSHPLMCEATVPLIYYGFYFDHKLQWVYWSLVRRFLHPQYNWLTRIATLLLRDSVLCIHIPTQIQRPVPPPIMRSHLWESCILINYFCNSWYR